MITTHDIAQFKKYMLDMAILSEDARQAVFAYRNENQDNPDFILNIPVSGDKKDKKKSFWDVPNSRMVTADAETVGTYIPVQVALDRDSRNPAVKKELEQFSQKAQEMERIAGQSAAQSKGTMANVMRAFSHRMRDFGRLEGNVEQAGRSPFAEAGYQSLSLFQPISKTDPKERNDYMRKGIKLPDGSRIRPYNIFVQSDRISEAMRE